MFEAGIGRGNFRSGNPQPTCLKIHHLDQWQVVLVVENRRAGKALEALRSGDMIDVRMGDDDLFYGELVLIEEPDDAGDVIAGIDYDGLAGGFIAKDRAVALERTDGEYFVDHGLRLKANPDLHRCHGLKRRDSPMLRLISLESKNVHEKAQAVWPALFGNSSSYFLGALWVTG